MTVSARRGLLAFAALAAAVALCLSAGLVGIAFPPGAWYAGLRKPGFTPPNWLFGPVWSALYTLMGVAVWRIWLRDGLRRAAPALGLFALQLALNTAWSWIFFGLHRPGWAFAEIVLLAATIAATIGAFRRHDRLAAWLLVPYLAWVLFAAALNLALWRMNA